MKRQRVVKVVEQSRAYQKGDETGDEQGFHQAVHSTPVKHQQYQGNEKRHAYVVGLLVRRAKQRVERDVPGKPRQRLACGLDVEVGDSSREARQQPPSCQQNASEEREERQSDLFHIAGCGKPVHDSKQRQTCAEDGAHHRLQEGGAAGRGPGVTRHDVHRAHLRRGHGEAIADRKHARRLRAVGCR